MKKSILISFFCALLLLTAPLFSCKKKQDEENGNASGTKETEKPTVALVMKSLANEFFKTMEEGAEKHQKKNSDQYELISNGIKNETDVAGQIQIVNQMINQNVDALVIAPADSKSLVRPCKKALENGIEVINIDNKLSEKVMKKNDIDVPFVGPNNRKGARMAAEYLAEQKLESGDKVAIVEGKPNAYNSIQRVKGFRDAMKKANVDVVASQAGNWEQNKASEVVSGMISMEPDLDAILCANDSMVLGATSALQSAGKLDQVELIGYDNIDAVQKLIKEGTVLCTIDQHADQIAVEGIKYALKMLKKDLKPKDRETPVDLITAEDLK